MNFLTASGNTLLANDEGSNAVASSPPLHFVSPSEHGSSFHPERTYDLPALVELSLANNPATRSAWFKALASAATVGEAKAPYYPKLSINASGGYSQTSYPTQNGPLGVNNLSLSPGFQIQYLLLDFGRRAADLRNTIALLEAANFDFNRKIQTTIFSLQQSYFSHTAAIAQEEAAAANLTLSRSLCDMVTAQKQSGLATAPDLLAAIKTLSRAELDLSTAQRNVTVTLGALRTIAGLPANAPLKVAPPSGNTHLDTISEKVDQLIERAIANRPDLAAKTSNIRAAQAATDRAKSDFLPKLSLQGTYNNDSFGFYARQGGTSGTYYGNYNEVGAFAVLSWDLFDGFERVEKVKKRQAEESQARADAQATLLETTRDVWTAYNDSLKARKQVTYATSLQNSAKEDFDSLQAAFQNGLATITDLLSSQSALANARFEEANAESDYLLSLASLALSIGHIGHIGKVVPEQGGH
jgi:outer membrane protein TolC